MKTTIEMPDELFRRAKTTAVARGQTLKQLITDALERELAEPVTVPESTEERAAKAEAFVRELEALASSTDSRFSISQSRHSFVQSQTWVKCRDTSLRLATLAADIAASCFLRGADALYAALAVRLQTPLDHSG